MHILDGQAGSKGILDNVLDPVDKLQQSRKGHCLNSGESKKASKGL